MRSGKLGVRALGAVAWLYAFSAQAAEPAEVHEGGSIASLIGFGANQYGLNFGVRGGYTLPSHLYLGGTLLGNTSIGGDTTLAGWGLGFTLGAEVGYDVAAGPLVLRPYAGLGYTQQTYNGGSSGVPYNATLCAEGQAAYCGTGATPNPNYNPTFCAEGAVQDCNPYLSGSGSPTAVNATTSSAALWVGGTLIYDFHGGPWFATADLRLGDAPGLFYQQLVFAGMVGGGYEF
jgi:hypothetical protein